ncbi:MAG: hypothetical protein ACT4QA_04185 [Panacagrimonas sp.]
MKQLAPYTLLSMLLAFSGAASAADTYSSGSADDPKVRSALFLGGYDRYYSALSELLKVQTGSDGDFEAAPEYWSGLAEFYLSYGMRDRSEAIYRTVAASAADPLLAGKARLRLAEFEYERGYLDEARASLLRAREKLPEKLTPAWSDLYARVLMAQGRYNEAVDILEGSDSRDDDEGYLRYNLGVALINDGRTALGRTALDRVGRLLPIDENGVALRDKANVTLGWHFLQNQLGASAKPVLARVRSEGPYANRALLGIGWAEIAPGGERQSRADLSEEVTLRNDPFRSFSALGALLRRGYLDDPYDRAGLRSFRRTKIAVDEEDGLRRALLAWAELIDRDPQDPSVQESWLAIPFALDRLGAHTQAVQYYEQAAERLETARKRTVAALDAVRGGRMVETMVRGDDDAESGWMWELRDLPDAPETYYLQTLIAEHGFAERLKNYRDVRLLSSSLDGWKTRIEQMDQNYRQSERSPVDPVVQFARAKRNWRPPVEEIDLQLTPALTLSTPGQYSRKVQFQRPPVPRLKLSAIPARFDGPWERLQSLKARVGSLAKPLSDARTEGARQLRKLASDELSAQKLQIEKYLVECRFALARLYDRGLPDLDQDEFEVKNGEAPPSVKLQRGEVEIDKSKPLENQITPPKPSRAPPTRRSSQDEYEVK